MSYVVIAVIVLMSVSCTRPAADPEQAALEEHQEESVLNMTREAQGHVGLEVAVAAIRTLNEYLQVTGTVQPIDNRVSHVRPLAAGRIVSVAAKVGDRVSVNQVLATFDNIEAGDVIAQYQEARSDVERLNVQMAAAQQRTERNRQLADIGAIPRKEYELSLVEEKSMSVSIEAQQSVVAGLLAKLRRLGLNEADLTPATMTQIRAPFAGVIIAADAAPGEVVSAASELFQIADLSNVWVQAEVYEKDLGRIQLGQTASIAVDTYPGEEFLGRVTYISDILDSGTRTARVRCDVSNATGRLKLDMFATVQLPTTFTRDALAIPVEAVQQLQGKNVVFVRTGETTFEARGVELGRTIRGLVEIVVGLQGGESVVTRGAFHLKSIALGEEIGEEH